MIERIASKDDVKIMYINHYDPPTQKIKGSDLLHGIIYNTILYYITHANYKIACRRKRPELDISHYKNMYEQKTDLTRVKIDPFLLTVKKTPAVLFLVNPCYNYNGGAYDYEDYILKIKTIASALKEKGAFIYIKGHPRMGSPRELEGFYDEKIDDFVISELINYTRFSIVVGCESTAIANAALEKKTVVVSIIDLLKSTNNEKIHFFKQYLNELSHNNIHFVSSIGDILCLYEQKVNVS